MIDKRSRMTSKAILRKTMEQCLVNWPYVSVMSMRGELAKAGTVIKPATLNRYLVEFVEAGLLFHAGRGWYSRVATPFELDITSVKPLADDLAKAFPLISFSCWSTEQVKRAMHHLLARFVTFVHVEQDAVASVSEHLRDAGWDVWLNPRGVEAGRFTVRERTVVVRRERSRSLSKGRFTPIEELLVDLWLESRDLQFMSSSDYLSMLGNLAGTRRISIATMLSLAMARKLKIEDILGADNQLTLPLCNRES